METNPFWKLILTIDDRWEQVSKLSVHFGKCMFVSRFLKTLS